MAEQKHILECEIHYNKIFWEMLLYIENKPSGINELYNHISKSITENDFKHDDNDIKKTILNCYTTFLNKIDKVKLSQLNINQLMDNLAYDVNKMEFALRDINDLETNKFRKSFNPEKLIGKIFSLKPLGTKNTEEFKITSIKRHFYCKEMDMDMVVYNVYTDVHESKRENGFPIFQNIIQSLIKYSIFVARPTDKEIKDTIEYKII